MTTPPDERLHVLRTAGSPVPTAHTHELAAIPEGSHGFLGAHSHIVPDQGRGSAQAVPHRGDVEGQGAWVGVGQGAGAGGYQGAWAEEGQGAWVGEGQGAGMEGDQAAWEGEDQAAREGEDQAAWEGEDQAREDVQGQGLLETLTRSVAESFQRGCEPPPLPALVKERPGAQQLDLGKAKYFVVFIVSSMAFLGNGFAGGLGVLYVPLLSEFNTTSAQAAVVQSLANGVILAGGMFSGIVVTQLGPGVCCMLGTIVAVLGCVASAFAWSVPTLIVTVGVITGGGLSLVFVTAWATVGQLAPALPSWAPAMLGLTTARGVLVFPVLNSTLLQLLGWRGVYLLLGGLLLHGLPGGLFVFFINRRLRGGAVPGRRGCRQVLVEAARPELFRSWRCVLFALPLVPLYAIINGPLFFLVDIGTDIGLDIAAGSQCLVLLGAMNVVARVLQALLNKCGD